MSFPVVNCGWFIASFVWFDVIIFYFLSFVSLFMLDLGFGSKATTPHSQAL